MVGILDLPYAQRRVVVVASDSARAPRLGVAVKDAAAVGTGLGLGSLLVGLVPVVGVATLAVLGAKKAYDVVNDNQHRDPSNRPDAGAGVLVIDHAAAVRELTFPSGHPLLDQAYVGHPLVHRRYHPFASFHRLLFEEKVNELMTLLASLGATRARVACRRGYRSSTSGSGGASDSSTSVEGSAGTSSSQKSDAVFEERFRPRGPAAIPEGLVWLGEEPSWTALADRRMRFGLTTFKVALQYEDDFGVNAKLKIGLEGLGFSLGGSFSTFESTLWEFEGEFGEG